MYGRNESHIATYQVTEFQMRKKAMLLKIMYWLHTLLSDFAKQALDEWLLYNICLHTNYFYMPINFEQRPVMFWSYSSFRVGLIITILHSFFSSHVSNSPMQSKMYAGVWWNKHAIESSLGTHKLVKLTPFWQQLENVFHQDGQGRHAHGLFKITPHKVIQTDIQDWLKKTFLLFSNV